jgi:hypothetical protein
MPSRHQKIDVLPAFQKRNGPHQKKGRGDETFKEKTNKDYKKASKIPDTGPAITNNINEKKPLHVHFSEDEYIIIDIEIPAQERETVEDEIKFIKEVNMETRSAKTSDHQVLTHDSRPAITNNTNDKKPLHVHFPEDEYIIIDIENPAQESETVEDEIKIIKEVNMETRSAKTPGPAITNNTNENAPLDVYYSEDEPVIIDIETPAQERKTSEDEIEIIKEVR